MCHFQFVVDYPKKANPINHKSHFRQKILVEKKRGE